MTQKANNPFDMFLDEALPVNPPAINPEPNVMSFQRFDFPNETIRTIGFGEDLHDDLQETIPIHSDFKSKAESNEEKLGSNDDSTQQPPLLEDLGIDPQSIKLKILTVVTLNKSSAVLDAPDLTGPIIIAVALGVFLLLAGKLHFGDILGLSVFGSILLYLLLNMMSKVLNSSIQAVAIVPVYTVLSVLGYCQAPMLVLGMFRMMSGMSSPFLILISISIAVWSAAAATIFFGAILELESKKWLVGFPVFLYYLVFVEIILF